MEHTSRDNRGQGEECRIVIIFVFKARFRPEKMEEARSAFESLIPKVLASKG
jgi:hypothetical protein